MNILIKVSIWPFICHEIWHIQTTEDYYHKQIFTRYLFILHFPIVLLGWFLLIQSYVLFTFLGCHVQVHICILSFFIKIQARLLILTVDVDMLPLMGDFSISSASSTKGTSFSRPKGSGWQQVSHINKNHPFQIITNVATTSCPPSSDTFLICSSILPFYSSIQMIKVAFINWISPWLLTKNCHNHFPQCLSANNLSLTKQKFIPTTHIHRRWYFLSKLRK